MAKLKLPDAGRLALKTLASLSTEERQGLAEKIREVQPSLVAAELIESVTANFASKIEVAEMVRMLLGLYYFRLSQRLSPEQIVSDVVEEMKNSEFSEPSGGWASFKENLEVLLSIEVPLGVTSKALDVQTQHQRVFSQARIVTDLRPVFGVDPAAKPTAAVIVHTLKIEYRESGTKRQVFIALDKNDLKELKDLLDLAEKKEASIEALLEPTNLPILAIRQT